MSVPDSALPRPRQLVLADVLPGERVRDAVLVVAYAAVTGLFAQLSLTIPPLTPVPFTGQTFPVLLGAAALGANRAAAGMLLYVAAGLTPWVPWFAGGDGGVDEVGSASFGYLIGFVLAAAVVGKLAERGWDRAPARVVVTMVVGNLVIYAAGVPWLMVVAGFGIADGLVRGAGWFVFGDAVKLALAAGLLPSAWALTGRRHE